MRSLRSHPYADGRDECKDGLNASLALLVLEHNIKKCGRPRTVWYCDPPPYADGRVECKKSLSEAVALLVHECKILFKRIVYKCVPPYSVVLQSPTPTPLVGLSARET